MFEVDVLQEGIITVGAVFVDDDVDDLLQDYQTPPQSTQAGFAYTFKAESTDDWKVGDYALAHTCSSLKLVRVVRVDDVPHFDPTVHYQLKWLVQKIEIARFAHRLAEEKHLRELIYAMEVAEKRKALQKRIADVADDPHVQALKNFEPSRN